MADVVTPDQLRGLLRQNRNVVGQFEPWHHFEALAAAVLAARSAEGEIGGSDVERIVREQSTAARHVARVRRRLSRLLSAGNQLNIWRSPLPPEQVLRPRPSVAPRSMDEYRRQEGAMSLERYFRCKVMRPGLDSNAALLGAAMLLASRLGAAEPVIYGILANLRYENFDVKTGWLITSSQPSLESSGQYRIQLPEPIVTLLRWQRTSLPRRKRCWYFAGALSKQGDGGLNRLPDAESVAASIKAAYAELLARYKAEFGISEFPLPRTFIQFLAAARQNAISIGIPPNLITLMSGYPLPVSPPHLSLIDAEPTQPRAKGSGEGFLNKAETLSPGGQPSRLSDPTLFLARNDWTGFVQSELKAYLHRLGQDCTGNGYLKKGRSGAVYEALEDFDHRAAVGLPTVNLLRVLLQYGAHKLLEDRVKLDSLSDVYRRLAKDELLADEQTLDLECWDEESVVELSEVMMAKRSRPQKSTRQADLAAWVSFLNFARTLEGVGQYPPVSATGIIAMPAARAAILTPREADLVTSHLVSLSSDCMHDRLALVSAFALGMYAGLRASEVLNIKLGDIHQSGQSLRLWIPSGKTRAARRQLWLDALLPEQLRGYLIDFLNQRAAERRADITKATFPLFGRAGVADPMQRSEIIDPLIWQMRRILHRPVDFHLLRHSFCSWLLVRAYLIDDPAMGDNLTGIEWRLREPASLNALAAFLRYPLPANHRNAGMSHDMWNRIARVMGHSSPLTLMTTYAHTLGAIHSASLRRISRSTPRRDIRLP